MTPSVDPISAPAVDEVDPSTGLTAAEVAQRVAAGETNAYEADTSRSAASIIRANVFTLFNGIVFACFGVLFALGRWQDALFGFAAVANAVIGSVQEFRAKAALDRLALLNAAAARVRRDGVEAEIAPGEVVLGDILVLRAGDQVPADARVVTSRGLQIDESMLTGEADAVDKRPGDDALSGSIVVGGDGDAQVVRVGADAYANAFADEAKRFSLVGSELRDSINRVLTWVGWGIGPIGLLVLNAQMQVAGGWRSAWQSGAWVQAVVNTIASLTAMIPLGLVLMTSITFAVGAARLAARQVLVNELPAVEGLARVDVICLDKTGTLTEGQITYGDATVLVEADRWQRVLGWYGTAPDANATARTLRGPFGEEAPLEASESIAFSSARKWSAVSFAGAEGTWVLGAPEMIFGASATDRNDPLGAVVIDRAASGRRTLVLGLAPASLTAAQADAEELPAHVRPVAVLTFREKVRSDAAQTLEYFREQGVGIRVISGDNPRTVAAIAREVGLDVDEGYDARTLPDDDDALADVMEEQHVFGRVSPEQKKRMVVALQSRGHTVAMTGDGVNDALAIKTADIGIAMNSGAAATKAVARLVLLDGRFSHLPDVVAEGRQVIANIERVSMLFLTKTTYATLLAILFGVLLLEFPFLPRQLSITDGLTIGIPAFFLALMPNAQRYIPGFLRRSLSFAIPAGLVVAITLTTYTLIVRAAGIGVDEVRTGATIILAVVGIWILSVLSRPLNRYKGAVVGAMFVALVVIFSIGFARGFFVLVDPSQLTATVVAVCSLAAIIAVEIVRAVQKRVIARAEATGGTPAIAAHPTDAPRRPIPVSIAVVLVYLGGLASALFGLLFLLARYDVPGDEVFEVSLIGVGIMLFGLLSVAAAAGLSHASGLSRVFVTAATGVLVALQVWSLVVSHDWSWWSAVQIVVYAVVVTGLWAPPAGGYFRPVLHAGRG
ncbi:HAD-IC family P-type ATPase [Microbacterium dextranolyticum]|uniref:Haloacid dehalogenase n=1 Tax=Microbacterium dextranolyticum TaxID=36806 RepID=A0A9W6HKV7_9MICO|nr:HAD-IC family P-type ATPase [Microbacterium dextranolyticum]MBM7462243.1 cation-transporting ATPase E [Microbacterium dextranolyticum]GLJ94495.1 haloacid dehalogenase [Microbacterium dextranolyticum]